MNNSSLLRPLHMVISFMLFTLFFSCQEQKTADKEISAKETSSKQNMDSGNLHLISTQYFYKLKLTHAQYNKFKTITPTPNQLVFVFYYPNDTLHSGSPQLYAYAMEHGNKADDYTPEKLDFDIPSSEAMTGREIFLGNLQVKMSELKKIIKQSTGSETGEFDYLLFTPKYGSEAHNEKYIYYDIMVEGGAQLLTGSTPTNPSPPATAY